MKYKPQTFRKGRLAAFYESREYLTDEDVRDERYTERTQQDSPPERPNRSYRRRRKQRESSRRNEDAETMITSSNLFKLGSAGLSIAIDMVLTAFDPCGALQDIIPDPPRHEDDPLNESRQNRKNQPEEIHLERTLTVPYADEKGCEDATLISGLTDVFT
ncbi:unnamed protein product [Cylindrotheca closterium]|uniref:Uncharacterized protein n=1 Tax=Cylindrotheca closterium TaxID=2856 RepID=A0AAD2CU98_9STRA|nr:unnamed protein product [Cylindrotheca closterium]